MGAGCSNDRALAVQDSIAHKPITLTDTGKELLHTLTQAKGIYFHLCHITRTK